MKTMSSRQIKLTARLLAAGYPAEAKKVIDAATDCCRSSSSGDFSKEVRFLESVARHERVAAKIKPGMWQKIVSKIPGVCKYLSWSDKKLAEKIKEAEALLDQIKKADKDGDEKKVEALARRAMQLYLGGDPGAFNWHRFKKRYIEWIKLGRAIEEMRKQGTSEGLKAACDARKDKKKAEAVVLLVEGGFEEDALNLLRSK
jgi:hypothetical protein